MSSASLLRWKSSAMTRSRFDKLGNVIGWMGERRQDHRHRLPHRHRRHRQHRTTGRTTPMRATRPTTSSTAAAAPTRRAAWPPPAYGAKIMKDLGLIPEGYKIMVVGSVQEEDCDGMCWQSIVNEYFNGPEDARNQIEFVISTEPTDGGIYRGHRGRMEIRVDMHGVSCHGSAPERGDNAIHKMAEVIAKRPRPQRERRDLTAPRSRALSRCSTRSTTPSTTKTRASWAAAPAPPARSSTPPRPAAPLLTPAPSPSTAA